MRLDTERPDHQTQVIRVIGDLDGENAPLLVDVPAQTDPPARRRVVDLTEMTFMDSAGMRALLALERATREAGGQTVLVLQEDAYVRRLLEVRGVIDRFHVVATRAEALTV